MTAKTKFEQLIEFVINDEEQKAHELFHDIVVEKSREIYENIMNEEDEEEELEEGSMDDSSGRAQEDLMHEVETDQEGSMNEEEGDEESDAEADDEAEEAGEEETKDIEAADDAESDMSAGEGDIEDRVVDLEDKLDELMAEFEALMGDEEVAGDDEFDMEPMDGEVGGDAEMGDDTAEFTDVEVPMTEAVSLIKVAAAKMGDDGANTKSPTRFNSGATGMQGKPVKNTAAESNPDGTAAYKAPTSYADKGRGDLKGAGNFKNVPGKSSSPKLEAAPKPKAGDNGSNTRTPFPKG